MFISGHELPYQEENFSERITIDNCYLLHRKTQGITIKNVIYPRGIHRDKVSSEVANIAALKVKI